MLANMNGNMLNDVDDILTQNDRTIYVAALPKSTTDFDIQSHFLTFGKIALLNHKTNLVTGESRGFAFVTFQNMNDYEKALNTTGHCINNKKVVIKKAEPKQGIIFVGKLPSEDQLSEDSIKKYFSQYGVVDGIKRPTDQVHGGKKSFCFVYFQSADSAKAIISKERVTIDKFELEVGRATLNPSSDIRIFGIPPRLAGGVGFGRGNFAGYMPFPGYGTIPLGYGGMPYNGYIPNMSFYGGYDPMIRMGYNAVVPGYIPVRGRGHGGTRGYGGIRGLRTKPY